MKINRYIKELLYTHDCVIIPNLGGFILKYTEAEVESGEQTDVIKPPKKYLVFESNLVIDDGVLAGFLVDTGRIDAEEAQQLIASFVSDVNFTLSSGGEVYFDEVGYLRKNEQGEYTFEVDTTSNFYGDAFALNPIESTPVTPETPKPAKKSNKAIYIFLGLLLVVIIATIYPAKYYFWDRKKAHTSLSTKKVEKSEEKKEVIVNNTDIKEEPKKEVVKEEVKEEPVVEKKEVVQPNPIQPGGIYLIANSFRDAANAQKFAEELKKNGYSSEVLADDGGRIRVSVGKYSTESEARTELKKFLSKKLDVWILRK